MELALNLWDAIRLGLPDRAARVASTDDGSSRVRRRYALAGGHAPATRSRLTSERR
jgi:hypothetical protein